MGLPPSDPRSLCPLSSTEFVEPPPTEITKALQNRAKLKSIVKTVKKIAEFTTPTPQDVRKNDSKNSKTT